MTDPILVSADQLVCLPASRLVDLERRAKANYPPDRPFAWTGTCEHATPVAGTLRNGVGQLMMGTSLKKGEYFFLELSADGRTLHISAPNGGLILSPSATNSFDVRLGEWEY